jgi:hypothetical protein
MSTPSESETNSPQSEQPINPKCDDLPPWDDLDAKKEVFETIIGRILMSPELGKKYVDCPEEARKDIKELINVPDEVKIVFLPAGDSNTPGGGSVVIELPPDSSHLAAVPTIDKMELFLCTYNPW